MKANQVVPEKLAIQTCVSCKFWEDNAVPHTVDQQICQILSRPGRAMTSSHQMQGGLPRQRLGDRKDNEWGLGPNIVSSASLELAGEVR